MAVTEKDKQPVITALIKAVKAAMDVIDDETEVRRICEGQINNSRG